MTKNNVKIVIGTNCCHSTLVCPFFKKRDKYNEQCINKGAIDLSRKDLPEGSRERNCKHFPQEFFDDPFNQNMMKFYQAYGILCYSPSFVFEPITPKTYRAKE